MKTLPVLILVFNRIDALARQIAVLKIYKAQRIFIACDGGRPEKEGELENVEKVKQELLHLIDWPCEIKTLFRDENLGCKLAVSQAVQWFFAQVGEGIVLEDDCIPSPAFFSYVAEMLDVYRNDKRVATIGGRRELLGEGTPKFSSKFFCWGWASWGDRINGIDVEFGYQKHLPANINTELSFAEKQHVKGIHNLMLTGMVNSWAYSYDLWFRAQGQLHLVPAKNYISNVGIGSGTHDTKQKEDGIASHDTYDSLTELIPVQRDADYMQAYFRQVYSPLKILLFPFVGDIKRFLRKLSA
ncbi:hypothetical protein [Psychromonas sp. MME2]|uniref:hypothetical protein n=1 Tax=unclassified Psychromonas TaxID=2614957 RepID=UPI00339CB93A